MAIHESFNPATGVLTVNVGTVEGGKYKTATSKVPVPAIEKW